MKRIFNRDELYQEIWQSSVKQVADKYQLNYSKLLQSCKAANIPTPTSKFIYNKKHNLPTEEWIIPLPSSNLTNIEVEMKINPTIREKEDIAEEKTEVAQPKIKNEDSQKYFNINKDSFYQALNFLPEEKVTKIYQELIKFNPNATRKLNKHVKEYKEEIKEWKRREKLAKLSYFHPNHQRNTLQKPDNLDNVSKEQQPRVYQLLNTLYTLFEKFGETIPQPFTISIGSDEVRFEIIESKDKITHILTPAEEKELAEYNENKKYARKPNIRKYDYIPNGLLRIKFINQNTNYIKDTKEQTLEEMLPEIILKFYQNYWQIRTKREEWEEQKRIEKEEKRLREERRELVNKEKERTIELLNTIKDIKLAKEIRAYAETLMKSNKVSHDEIEWILKKADWIDPLISREDSLLGHRNHKISKEDKLKALKKEGSDYYWY